MPTPLPAPRAERGQRRRGQSEVPSASFPRALRHRQQGKRGRCPRCCQSPDGRGRTRQAQRRARQGPGLWPRLHRRQLIQLTQQTRLGSTCSWSLQSPLLRRWRRLTPGGGGARAPATRGPWKGRRPGRQRRRRWESVAPLSPRPPRSLRQARTRAWQGGRRQQACGRQGGARRPGERIRDGAPGRWPGYRPRALAGALLEMGWVQGQLPPRQLLPIRPRARPQRLATQLRPQEATASGCLPASLAARPRSPRLRHRGQASCRRRRRSCPARQAGPPGRRSSAPV